MKFARTAAAYTAPGLKTQNDYILRQSPNPARPEKPILVLGYAMMNDRRQHSTTSQVVLSGKLRQC